MIECAAKGCIDHVVRNVRTKRGPMYACVTHERLLRDAGELLDRLDAAPVGHASLLDDAPVRARPQVRVVPPPVVRPLPATPRPTPSPEPPMPPTPSASAPSSVPSSPVASGTGGGVPSRATVHPPLVVDPEAPAGRCRIVGCAAPVSDRGLCSQGYGLWYRSGKPEGVALPALSPAERGKRRAAAVRAKAGAPPVVEAPVPAREPETSAEPVVDREPDRDAFEGYDVDSRCDACGKWGCGAGESPESSPWKVCRECSRCGECGHEEGCEGAQPEHAADTLDRLTRELAAAAEALTAAGVTPTGTLTERVAALAGDVVALRERAVKAEAELAGANAFLATVTHERDHAQQVEVPDALDKRHAAEAALAALRACLDHGFTAEAVGRDFALPLADGVRLEAFVERVRAREREAAVPAPAPAPAAGDRERAVFACLVDVVEGLYTADGVDRAYATALRGLRIMGGVSA